MVEVVVEFEYKAHHEDELTIHVGDVIKNVKRLEEEGWMEGDLNGRRGMFPDNFVKEIKKNTEPKEEPQPTKREGAGNVASLVQRMSTIGLPSGGFLAQSNPKNVKRRSKKRQYRVTFDYSAQHEDELELKVGDVVDFSEEVEEGWWNGSVNGKFGLFPSNFVREIEGAEDEEERETTEESEASSKEVPCSSLASPTSPLSSPGPGNEAVAQPKKIRGVGFGDIFKEGSVKLKSRLPSTDCDEKKLDKPLPPIMKPANVNMTDVIKPEEGTLKVKEYCKACFTYEGTNEDELSLKEGDIIRILSKVTGEPGWWKGEINGKEGVFPDNFVTMATEAERDAANSKASIKLSPKPEIEDKPKKPPPPKSPAIKPEIPNAEKKPLPLKLEEKASRWSLELEGSATDSAVRDQVSSKPQYDKPLQDIKPNKPVAPLIPPKKPVPPPGKFPLIRPGMIPPKRPEKPQPQPSVPVSRPNGDVPFNRPKSECEPASVRTKDCDFIPTSRPKSVEITEKSGETDLMSFDDITSTSEKLSHPTTNRPKMPNRRLPAQFAGVQLHNKELTVEKTVKMEEKEVFPKPKLADIKKNKDVSIEKDVKVEEEEILTKPKLIDIKKPSIIMPPAPVFKPNTHPAAPPDMKPKVQDDMNKSEMEDLRAQINELIQGVELMKIQQQNEIANLRSDLNEEKEKRVALQMEIEQLKKAVLST
ncbi:CD2-associated protein isoform X1 [Erpetoichthys calabaricus]|uniref:Osteoclast-stimulating factor 1 n=1 Tax=Erpetoichthys calabaricus TaxID=27687 RepID=A0A8C4S7Y8_ERPCA|nr:CD2-associated protein isoform X1 [Erpetoichthys calabaricus]